MPFLIRKRTSDNCSFASVGKLSKSSTETRTLESGRIRAASRRLRPPFCGTMPRTVAASFSGSRLLSRDGDTEIMPPSSGRKSNSGSFAVRAMATPASESSKAKAGGGSRQRAAKGRFIRRNVRSRLAFLSFNKCDFIDLFQRAGSELHLGQRRLAQKSHPLFARRAPDLGRRPLVQNHLANVLGKIQQLMNRRPAAETGTAALETA